MKMIKIILLSTSLFLGAPAIADSLPPTKTYEVLVKVVRMPRAANGTISVRECDACDYETYRVTANTRYMLNGKNMRLKDFSVVIQNLRRDGDHVVNVTRDIQSNTITKVFVYTQ